MLGSRLAIWLLTDADLKVYLAGTPEVRARRIAGREGVPYATALATMNERDTLDRGRYLALYDIDIDDYRHADLVLDTAAAGSVPGGGGHRRGRSNGKSQAAPTGAPALSCRRSYSSCRHGFSRHHATCRSMPSTRVVRGA